ncbi:helix-turn-helix domain-containing protein [Spirillospora sp. NPDC047279]|uniref:TetR/AcrR family transcriptional regulator n=1 Tax=Spirillospora sp. NPDC047279 TaxID=3155478 RepID=UPI0033FB809D
MPPARQSADRRELLLRAAADLFAERAYDEVTTTEIARRAGVAYGLIAHHFGNKRGLYLATVRAAAERLREIRESPPGDATPQERLRDVLDRHIRLIDDNASGYLTVMSAGLGSDEEVRAIIEEYRWDGALRVLRALGVEEPVPPVLRTATRGWTAYLNEIVVDRLTHGDVDRAHLVELAAAVLGGALRAAAALDPACGLLPADLDALDP